MDPPRGEVTIVIAGREGAVPRPDRSAAAIAVARARVLGLVAAGLSRSAAAKQVAAETGLPRRELFREV